MPQSIAAMDPVDRLVDFRPTKQPYDPRHMLTGAAENGNRAFRSTPLKTNMSPKKGLF